MVSTMKSSNSLSIGKIELSPRRLEVIDSSVVSIGDSWVVSDKAETQAVYTLTYNGVGIRFSESELEQLLKELLEKQYGRKLT